MQSDRFPSPDGEKEESLSAFVSAPEAVDPSSRPALAYGIKDAALQYGTFGGQQQQKGLSPTSHSHMISERLETTGSEISRDYYANTVTVVTETPLAATVSRPKSPYEDLRYGDSNRMLTKAEIDHLIYDATDGIRQSPDEAHWWKTIAATFFCPLCGVVSIFYAFKSEHSHRSGFMDSARQMLRHSDFCWRLSVIFGLLLWFLCLIFWVLL